MIAVLKGVVDEVDSNSIYLDVNGVIYEVYLSLFDLESCKVGERIKIYIEEIIREDSYTLFGFLKRGERDIFRELIKINGIGAKVAMAILSTLSIDELLHILDTNNEKALTKVPKIGLKTAKRILNELIDLRDKIASSIDIQDGETQEKRIAIEALEQLGFKRSDILKVVNQIETKPHQEIIREALRQLTKV